MKRRIKAVGWILMAALALGGCSLAREDAAGSADQFVGVNVALTRMDGTYEAEREYELDGSESYLALIEETDEGTGDKSVGFEMGAWIMEPKQATHIKDVSENTGRRAQTRREETYSVEASVYAAPDGLEDGNVSWRLDPVYRRADGTLYAVSKAVGVAGSVDSSTQKQSATYDVKDKDGKTVARTVEISVTMKVKAPTQRAMISEMSADNTVLARHELDLDALEQTGWGMSVSKDAEWLLLEKYEDGEVRRIVCEFGNDSRARCGFLRPQTGVSVPEGCTALGISTLTVTRGE